MDNLVPPGGLRPVPVFSGVPQGSILGMHAGPDDTPPHPPPPPDSRTAPSWRLAPRSTLLTESRAYKQLTVKELTETITCCQPGALSHRHTRRGTLRQEARRRFRRHGGQVATTAGGRGWWGGGGVVTTGVTTSNTSCGAAQQLLGQKVLEFQKVSKRFKKFQESFKKFQKFQESKNRPTRVYT